MAGFIDHHGGQISVGTEGAVDRKLVLVGAGGLQGSLAECAAYAVIVAVNLECVSAGICGRGRAPQSCSIQTLITKDSEQVRLGQRAVDIIERAEVVFSERELGARIILGDDLLQARNEGGRDGSTAVRDILDPIIARDHEGRIPKNARVLESQCSG